LGAFLESQKAAQLAVPAVRPGRSAVVETTLRAPGSGNPQLPEDTLRMLHPARTSWAGNFDVLIDAVKLTERHEATCLPLVPGRSNFAVFEVGDRRDEYRFSFRGPGQDWSPRLTSGPQEAMRAILDEQVEPGPVLPPHQWLGSRPGGAVTLSFEPPADARVGLLAVVVEQRSTGREAMVEFAFGTDRIPRGSFDR